MTDLRGSDRCGEMVPTPGKLVERELTGQVIGAFYAVYNELRHGFLETVYAGALEYELEALGLPYVRELPLDVRYKGVLVGCYRADFVIAGTLLLELKASASVGVPDKRQLLNYLRATDLRVGLLLHFGPEATFARVVNSHAPLNAEQAQPEAKDLRRSDRSAQIRVPQRTSQSKPAVRSRC